MSADAWAERVAAFEWISLAVPVLGVDTSDGYDPMLPEIAAFAGRDEGV